VSIASDLDVVQKSGSWFAYGETRLGQGKEKAVAFLAGEVALAGEIRQKVLDALASGRTQASLSGGDEAEVDA